MPTALVVQMSVPVNNSPIQDHVHPDDHTQPTNEMTPGFKPFTRVGMPHRPRNAFRPSLDLFSVRLMLRAPVGSPREEDHLREASVVVFCLPDFSALLYQSRMLHVVDSSPFYWICNFEGSADRYWFSGLSFTPGCYTSCSLPKTRKTIFYSHLLFLARLHEVAR